MESLTVESIREEERGFKLRKGDQARTITHYCGYFDHCRWVRNQQNFHRKQYNDA